MPDRLPVDVADRPGAGPVGTTHRLLRLGRAGAPGLRAVLHGADGTPGPAHAESEPGYLGGLALLSSPMNTTSCSAWRTFADAALQPVPLAAHA